MTVRDLTPLILVGLDSPTPGPVAGGNKAVMASPTSGHTVSAVSDLPPRMRKLLKIEEVLAAIPFKRTAFYAAIAAGIFPKPIHIGGGHGSFWVEDEIIACLAAYIAAPRPMVAPVRYRPRKKSPIK